jgi:hypothetical protein
VVIWLDNGVTGAHPAASHPNQQLIVYLMKKQITKLTLSLFATAIVAAPLLAGGQEPGANPPPAPRHSERAKPKTHETTPFNGKVTAVDTKAMTLTIKNRTYEVTSETKITKDGQPAVLSDIAVGDKVGGAYKKTDGGKLSATTINVSKQSDRQKGKEKEPKP